MTTSWNDVRKVIERREKRRASADWTLAEGGAGPGRPRTTPKALRLYFTLVGALAVSVLAGLGAIFMNYLLWTWLLHVDF